MLQEKTFSVLTKGMAATEVAGLPPLTVAAPSLSKAAIIGNFPPRLCGIATFTRDTYACLTRALPKATWQVIAMNDPNQTYEYPDSVTHILAQNDMGAYKRLAADLNASGTQVLFVQHEFGIYGGSAGTYLLELLGRVNMPVVTTLHTVLETPNDDQRRVMEGLIRYSSTLITMAEKGADILRRVYGVAPSQIAVIPHGAPFRPLADTNDFKAALGVEGKKTLTTFGLLSPNKGIETVIKALPAVVAQNPDMIYLVVGATHPHLVAHEGEAYRDGLIRMAQDLGVADHVRFINEFMNDDALIDILRATDVYVTPYLTETQITSGTLSYALALGRPVVSTPYWHAQEALADGSGVLCPFNDVDAFARALSDLLQSDEKRAEMSERAYRRALPSRWSEVAKAYVARAEKDMNMTPKTASEVAATAFVNAVIPRPIKQSAREGAPPSWQRLARMSDDCGIFQHGKFRLPDRNHGYCTDDNVRALSLAAKQSGINDPAGRRVALAYTYAAFVNHAWMDEGRFRNFMSYGRDWLDDGGSDDCCARAFESLVDVARSDLPDDLRLWAVELGQRVLPHIGKWDSNRSRAILLKALVGAEGVIGDRHEVLAHIRELSRLLHHAYLDHSQPDHQWFEPQLSYDNARLSEGLILAAHRLKDEVMLSDGLTSLAWVMKRQTCAEKGHFQPVATSHFCLEGQDHPIFDQQPIEVYATIEACMSAWKVTGDILWKTDASRAFAWFTGTNTLGVPLITEDGGCFDGLTPVGPNANQGAESILAYHQSWTALAADL